MAENAMKHDSPAPLAGLSPELLAAAQQVLREGESLLAFVEAAVQRLLEQRRAQAADQHAVQEAAPVSGSGHAADELLAQLETWMGGGSLRRVLAE